LTKLLAGELYQVLLSGRLHDPRVGGRTRVLRVIAALAVGAVLAIGTSVAVVNVAAPTPEPPNRPLYNYGTR
jgi:hypothetical protein